MVRFLLFYRMLHLHISKFGRFVLLAVWIFIQCLVCSIVGYDAQGVCLTAFCIVDILIFILCLYGSAQYEKQVGQEKVHERIEVQRLQTKKEVDKYFEISDDLSQFWHGEADLKAIYDVYNSFIAQPDVIKAIRNLGVLFGYSALLPMEIFAIPKQNIVSAVHGYYRPAFNRDISHCALYNSFAVFKRVDQIVRNSVSVEHSLYLLNREVMIACGRIWNKELDWKYDLNCDSVFFKHLESTFDEINKVFVELMSLGIIAVDNWVTRSAFGLTIYRVWYKMLVDCVQMADLDKEFLDIDEYKFIEENYINLKNKIDSGFELCPLCDGMWGSLEVLSAAIYIHRKDNRSFMDVFYEFYNYTETLEDVHITNNKLAVVEIGGGANTNFSICIDCGCILPKGRALCSDCMSKRLKVPKNEDLGKECRDECVSKVTYYNLSQSQCRRIFERDNYTCRCCGMRSKVIGGTATLQVCHRIPVSAGGSNDDDNLWSLCFRCFLSSADSYEQGIRMMI